MSFPGVFPFHLDKHDPSSFSFPSPQPSISSEVTHVDFDIESFTHFSPSTTTGLFDDIGALSPINSSTPSSTNLVSPKSSIADGSTLFPISIVKETDTVEALSNHHLERYLHYEALAAQAEADSRARQNEQIEALIAACSMPGDKANPTVYDLGNNPVYLIQPQQYFGDDLPAWDPSYACQPQQSAMMAHVQAQVHRQAHDAALALAQHHRSGSMHYYLPNASGTSFEPEQTMWSGQYPTMQAGMHSLFASTPTYSGVPPPILPPMDPMEPSVPPSVVVAATPVAVDGEIESDDKDDGMSERSRSYCHSDEDIKPVINIDDMSVPNLHVPLADPQSDSIETAPLPTRNL
ncbi:MAG: hypothetical protein TREMPRED_002197 [Tremellales sp. Tagirdzhanova-0007]|nr:MAG: hypothetical protein TREMPRED_002197 [Tremellales sp. Tagirdzhanova-0007]